MSTDTPTPGHPNFDSGLTDEETAAVVASARQTPERVTLTDEEVEALQDETGNSGHYVKGILAPAVERIVAAREQALREEIATGMADGVAHRIEDPHGLVTEYISVTDAQRIARGDAR